MKFPLKGLVFLTLACSNLFATTRYVAATVGTFSGGTACNGQTAITVSTLNSTTLSAGDTTYLCGTITAPAGSNKYIVISQSGTSANLISLLFDTNATLTAAYWSGPAIEIGGNSYVLVNGQNTGLIQATANGTNLANQQDSGIGVDAGSGCSNCEIKDLTISNIYVHACTLPISSCTDEGGQNTYGIRAVGGNNFKVDGNTVHDMKWAILYAYLTSSGFQAFNNTLYNMDHGFVFGDASSSSTLGTGSIYANDISNMGNWDDAGDENHHDGIHNWANNPGSTYSVQVYNNYFHGTGGQGMNTWIGLESSSVDSYIFNNLLTKTDNCPNGGVGLIGLFVGSGQAGMGTSILNNTIIGNGPGDGCPSGIGVQTQRGAVIKNNIVENTSLFVYIPTSGEIASGGINSNLYYNSANGFWCPGNIEVNFAMWQSGCGYDSNGVNSNPSLNSSSTLPSGSPAIALGANLTSLGVTVLDSGAPATFGASGACGTACLGRASSGNWDAGAYTYQNPSLVQPATSLMITVQ